MKLQSRLLFTAWIALIWESTWISLVTSEDVCLSPLGMEDGRIKDSQLKGTMPFLNSSAPKYARFNHSDGYGGWCPSWNSFVIKKGPSYSKRIQVNFDAPVRIRAIILQGRAGGKEKAELYRIYYRRNPGSWVYVRDEIGSVKVFKGNKDNAVQQSILVPPIIAYNISLVPALYPNKQVCMRFELLGCSIKNGLVAYTMPQGNSRGGRYNFTDSIYDGLTKDNLLSFGLGFLSDGRLAPADYVDSSGLGWIGWHAKDTPDPYVVFEFLGRRIFWSVTIHCNVRDRTGIKLFAEVNVSFSLDGTSFDTLRTHRPKDVTSGSSWINHNVTIDLCQHIGKYVKFHFTYAGEWILISEVAFRSDPLDPNSSSEAKCAPTVFPPPSTVPPSHTISLVNISSPSEDSEDGFAFTAGKIFEWYYIVGPLSAVIIITFVSWYICKRRMRVRKAKAANPDEELEYELEEMDHEVDKWEISRDRIVLRKVIGSGAFGVVWTGSLKEAGAGLKRQVIAAKCFTPTSGAEGRKALLKEIELGKQLQEEPQPNIITFVGCVTTRIHPILVMEYLPCGDLLGYLRKSRGIEDKYHCGEGEAVELSIYDLVSFARQIATGMVFLGSRGIIHRDLAARNVLLDKNCVCKITDFGLAYQNFKYGHGNAKKGRIPIKWTAPEILYGDPASLSSQSDVWSYGIVLYEIFTIGGIPYPGWTEGQTIAEIKGGYRMPKPAHIDETLYNVMTRCWQETPEFRPPFEPLRRKMIKYIEEELYTGLVDMAKYNGAQYSKVEDEGAQLAAEELVKDELKKKLLAKKKWKSVRAEAGAEQESVTDGPKEKKLAKRKWQSVRAEAGAKQESVTDGPKEKRLARKKWQSVRAEAGAKQELVTDGPKEKRLAKKKGQNVRAEAGAKEELVMDGPKEKASAKRKWMSFRN